jgi:hypothetical protein
MLADRDDELAAAIDDDRRAGPLELRTDGDLNKRNGEQHNEKDEQRSHLIPPRPDLRQEVTINGTENSYLANLTKMYSAENWTRFSVKTEIFPADICFDKLLRCTQGRAALQSIALLARHHIGLQGFDLRRPPEAGPRRHRILAVGNGADEAGMLPPRPFPGDLQGKSSFLASQGIRVF